MLLSEEKTHNPNHWNIQIKLYHRQMHLLSSKKMKFRLKCWNICKYDDLKKQKWRGNACYFPQTQTLTSEDADTKKTYSK